MAKTNDTACVRTNHKKHCTISKPDTCIDQDHVEGLIPAFEDFLSSLNEEELLTAKLVLIPIHQNWKSLPEETRPEFGPYMANELEKIAEFDSRGAVDALDPISPSASRASQGTTRPILSQFALFTAIAGKPDDHRYKFPIENDVLDAICTYLDRQNRSNMEALEAIASTFVEAHVGFYLDDCSANQGEAFLCKETRALMHHMAELAGQIKDNREIRQALEIDINRRSSTQGGACDA